MKTRPVPFLLVSLIASFALACSAAPPEDSSSESPASTEEALAPKVTEKSCTAGDVKGKFVISCSEDHCVLGCCGNDSKGVYTCVNCSASSCSDSAKRVGARLPGDSTERIR